MACKMILDMMKGDDSPMYDIVLQSKLLERQSIKDLRK
ncbi:hypothetical protein [Paenibacillus lautus]